jgi:hypothetical protein
MKCVQTWSLTNVFILCTSCKGCTTVATSQKLKHLHIPNFFLFVAQLIWSCKVIYLYKSECRYVCMFRHNYLSMNGIVAFPSFTWLYKYKQGEMWHSAQRAKISEEICMFQPGRCQATGMWFISAETNNEKVLIARQWFRNHGYMDGNNWSWDKYILRQCREII